MEPLPIMLINSNNNDKSDEYCVKIKLHEDSTPEKLDPYEFKMDFLITVS